MFLCDTNIFILTEHVCYGEKLQPNEAYGSAYALRSEIYYLKETSNSCF